MLFSGDTEEFWGIINRVIRGTAGKKKKKKYMVVQPLRLRDDCQLYSRAYVTEKRFSCYVSTVNITDFRCSFNHAIST